MNSFAALFTAYFEQLVILVRRDPDNVAGQKNALRSAMGVVPRGPIEIEPGIEHSEVPDDATLQGRLLTRMVETIRISPAASPAEILALARALAADRGPVPSTSAVTVALLEAGSDRDLAPAVEQSPPLAAPVLERSRTMAGPVGEAGTLIRALADWASQGRWMEAVHAAQALVRLLPRFPEHEQRSHLLTVRRVFTRPLLDEFIQFAMRTTEEQGRVSEILQYSGPEGIELMVDHIRKGEVVGPRRFLHDLLGAMPAALPQLLPLLQSPHWHEVRHGAELVGRLGRAEALEPLRKTLNHPDERVRKAVIDALARFDDHSVIEPIRRALSDAAPAARASAAHALAQRNSPGLALPILVALESEKDQEAWDALVSAVAKIDSTEAAVALVGIALDKRPLLRAGRPMSQRLAVVRALAQADTASSRKALERLAAEGFGQVRQAASAALDRRAN